MAETEIQPSAASYWNATRNFYDAGDKLRGFNRAVGPYANDETHAGKRNVFEEYFYDALGRRVMVRSRRSSNCSSSITECSNHLERTVWDGDQVVFEIRAPAPTGSTTAQMESDNGTYSSTDGTRFGQTAYVHAGGIDQPIVVMRMGYNGSSTPISVHPHQNWRGSFELGTKSDGTLMTLTSGAPTIAWAGARTTMDGEVARPYDGPIWFGNLIPGKADGSGLQYMRNRYYDPSTGRFTQQDPIGLAGGMNLYGFAGGDPVNFSDPFGLDCTDKNGNRRPCTVTWSAADKANPGVTKAMRQTIQEIADAAETDLVLSSGLRPGDSFNHGAGRAVDIKSINGVDVGVGSVANPAAAELVGRVQGAAGAHGSVRENFGPAGLWKSESPGKPQVNYNDGSAKRQKLQTDHMNHIHISIHP